MSCAFNFSLPKSDMSLFSEITIIGGGAIGLFTASAFVNAGFSVTVLEKNALGQESSWAGGGILLPLYPWRQASAISDIVRLSHLLYPQLAEQLRLETGIDPEWTACGLLMTQNPDYANAVAWCERYAVAYQDAGADLFTGLNTECEKPLWLPSIAQARNPRLLKALIANLRHKGVRFVEHCTIHAIEQRQGRVVALESQQGRWGIEQLVVCAGAWSGDLLVNLLPDLALVKANIAPVKGQMLLFKAQSDTLKQMVLAGDRYLIPRRDGHILVGSTVEQAGFNKQTTLAARLQLEQFALHLLPALQHYPLVNHWAGLRPATGNGVPYIDRYPQLANVYINAGHFRNGLVMGPGAAQLLVDKVLNRSSSIDLTPYGFFSPHE